MTQPPMTQPPMPQPPMTERQRPASDASLREVDTIVVGAGIAGIAAAAQLRRRGISDVLVVERADDVGGTWRDNVYPGVACDIPAHLYSYSFRPNPGWSRRFAPGAEIQEYLRGVVRDEGLTPQLLLGTDVTDMAWDDDGQRWRLSTSRGGLVCRVLILAAGRLSEPILPHLPGRESFVGPVMHSSAWVPGLDLAGARVAVVGTGASAVQLVPQLARVAAEVTVFQRTAPWVVPRADAPIPEPAREAFARDPESMHAHRESLFHEFEAGHAARVAEGAEREALRQVALDHLAAQVPDPALRTSLTPDYEIGCKRVLLSDDWYPALASGAVTLEPSAIVALEGNRAVAASGARHEVDALVFATGFAATRPPFAQHVRGRGGRLLADHWAEGMTAYASILVSGFPNLMVLDGPNAALGHNSAFPMIEAQAELACSLITRMRTEGVEVIEASPVAEQVWTDQLDAASRGTVWLSGCRSWYVDDRSSRLTLLWPGTATAFRAALRAVAEQALPLPDAELVSLRD
ncbi:NAD(P)/FAD-dependent oxidoreductase [Herbiconiux sp. CPCC 203407]|uniref:NAD(P)/FAD-dependent oxidoreductase n=1 Tax=Herbiconiux oxytropis TaxID=2970915 RepID=A0AA41XIB0_9MICO|nr:NAD(P)/FAD-dependent oxidoreductase [Herbiconiux oxytropis]MCS5723642.1 NAD(P)/FAD-dependent oxidoreductase [Herbiconiux oxytropis]MCS5726959.1 NAD(P)/FAD-dependent oxidoreductase [Herbiconiux oxytropis]